MWNIVVKKRSKERWEYAAAERTLQLRELRETKQTLVKYKSKQDDEYIEVRQMGVRNQLPRGKWKPIGHL